MDPEYTTRHQSATMALMTTSAIKCMNERTRGWINECMYERVSGLMNELTHESLRAWMQERRTRKAARCIYRAKKAIFGYQSRPVPNVCQLVQNM